MVPVLSDTPLRDSTRRAATVVARLRDAGLTLATCESLTAGLLTATLATVPGASAVLRGGLVTYATDLKHDLAGVPSELLAEHGAVSGETATAMAEGVRERCRADVAVALTGVAGPDPQEGRPPGTVWLGWSGPAGSGSRLLHLTGDRQAIRDAAVQAALEWLTTCRLA